MFQVRWSVAAVAEGEILRMGGTKEKRGLVQSTVRHTGACCSMVGQGAQVASPEFEAGDVQKVVQHFFDLTETPKEHT